MEYTHCLNAALDEVCVEEENKSKGRMGRRKYEDHDSGHFKSKNLGAERRRREKLSQRLLNLRSLVPLITNMNKATIIDDSITYITELKKNVDVLQGQLRELELERAAVPATKNKIMHDDDGCTAKGVMFVEETTTTTNIEVEPYVRVSNVEGGKKWWMKMIFEKKKGRITKLMEALTCNGFYLTDTTLTTSHGAVMLSSSVEVIMLGEIMLDASIMTKLLQGILSNL